MKLLILFLFANFAFAADSSFYANKGLQDKYPQAFALSASSVPFHKSSSERSAEKIQLIHEIRKLPALHQQILNFDHLDLFSQVKVLRQLFTVETKVLGIVQPELIIDETSIPGYAFFEFDLQKNSPGKVFLNLKKLREEKNKSEFIVLLLHETRHSAQLQLAQRGHGPLSIGYKASFIAQKELKETNTKMSFCDFMLLLNEYEAFQFANYVYGAITGWNTPVNDMGTLASQYDHQGELRLDILEVLQGHEEPYQRFNELEKEQFDLLN